ncbi:MAG: hypothetical protein IKL27_04420 [Oscillospiraceae bacterium]|nr:hypothetical protein [Oscillospiraceae bacterium]
MYNRYIGNTGKVYRIDDSSLPEIDARHYPAPPEPDIPQTTPIYSAPNHRPNSTMPFPFPGKELAGSLRGILGSFMPEGMDISDLLLILVLLLLYLEKEDEEILIILSVLILSGFK